MKLLQAELMITFEAYALAGIPVAAIALAGRLSPAERLPGADLRRWWSRVALLIALVLVEQWATA